MFIQPWQKRLGPLKAEATLLRPARLTARIAKYQIFGNPVGKDDRHGEGERIGQESSFPRHWRCLTPIGAQEGMSAIHIYSLLDQGRCYWGDLIPVHPGKTQQAVRQFQDPPVPVRRLEVVQSSYVPGLEGQMMWLIITMQMEFGEPLVLLQCACCGVHPWCAQLGHAHEGSADGWRDALRFACAMHLRERALGDAQRRPLRRPAVWRPLKGLDAR